MVESKGGGFRGLLGLRVGVVGQGDGGVNGWWGQEGGRGKGVVGV